MLRGNPYLDSNDIYTSTSLYLSFFLYFCCNTGYHAIALLQPLAKYAWGKRLHRGIENRGFKKKKESCLIFVRFFFLLRQLLVFWRQIDTKKTSTVFEFPKDVHPRSKERTGYH